MLQQFNSNRCYGMILKESRICSEGLLTCIIGRLKLSEPEAQKRFEVKFNILIFNLCALFGLFLVLVVSLQLTSAGEVWWGRLTFGSILIFMVGLALLSRYWFGQGTEKTWGELAGRTGLTFRTTGVWFGYFSHLAGIYRSYPLTLYIHERGRLQVPSTRIELTLKNPAQVYLRLCGPYESDGMDLNSLSNFFEAKKYQIGDCAFFIKSKPENLAPALFAPLHARQKPLRDQFLRLKYDINIEVEGAKLYFDQVGVLNQADYLHYLLDLVCDLAEAIERASQRVRI
jgi:hypothetical protein